MKTVMQLLSLLLCFEFVVAPVQGSLLMNSAMADDAKTCPAGQSYEAAVNRCLTKTEVLKVNQATQSCGANKECYTDNAKTALADAKEDYSDGVVQKSGLAKAANAAAIAIPLVVITSVLLEKRANTSGAKNSGGSGKNFTCNPPSLLLMYAAAAALGAGEIYGLITHGSKLTKIQEEWDATVVPKAESGADKQKAEATEAQSQAFEFLAQNEEQVGKTAKMKRGFYLAATGLFAAGAVAATVEMFQLKQAIIDRDLAITAVTPADKAIAEAKRVKAIQTVKRLSCYQDDKLGEKVRSTTEAQSYENEQNVKAEAEANKNSGSTSNTNNSNVTSEEFVYDTNGNLIQKNTTYGRPSSETNAQPAPVTTPKPAAPLDGDLEGVKINYIKPETKESLEKMKRVAAYNLSTAKDGEQFLNLMQEFESIEFENYSKVKYVEEDQSLQSIEFSPIMAKMIAEALIPQSHANLDVMGAIPLLTSLSGGMGSVMKILKFNNGKPISVKDMNAIKGTSSNFIIRAIAKPVTRIAINGVLGGWMAIQQDHMKKQSERATERAKKLRSMKEEFASANGLMYCKEEDRLDPTKPKCFCYTSDNKVNPSRTSNIVCKNALATIKNNTGAPDTEKVCVTTAMAMDSTCACRSTNTCLKTTSGFGTMGFSPNTFKMISANSGVANDLFNGNLSAGDIADSAGINAARTQVAAANAIAGDKAAVKESKAAADAFERGLLATTSGLNMGGSNNSSPLPATPAAAAAALEKEIKENKDIDVTNSGASISPSASFGNGVDEVPEFGMNSDSSNQEIEIAEVMGKEIDFGSNDINKTKDTNLFEVLSNRYQRSGMRRLFNEGKPAPADAPAKSDISN